MDFRRSIDDIVETVRNAQGRSRSCSLLIGAGCSVKGGVPLAGEFVQIIKDRYPQSYRRAEAKTYPQCMAELTLGERRDLIAEYVDKAKINWAHIGIACLLQAGYVDRVLTTNFDPLVMRACALLGEFPAVYDFAASQLLTPADIPDKAVFHLHGQRTGFVLMNTPAECQKQSERLGPVFQDAGRGRVWIVVGYSGENDPVFDHLARVDRFDNGLYWVGYQDSEPASHVSERLLTEGKFASYVNGWDADSFFVTLAQRLGIFPPSLLQQPFTHLDRIFQMLSPFSLPNEVSEEDVTRTPREWIQRAIKEIEQVDRSVADAWRMLMGGDYDGVVALRKQYETKPSQELAEALSWAYVMQGNSLMAQAESKTGEEADPLFAQAGEKFAAVLAIKPDKHEALNNWGNALLAHAKTKTGEEADRLFAQAEEKYAAALAVKPDKHEALYNWGGLLLAQGKTKTGEEGARLFARAGEKYAATLAVKPDKHEALNNWGNALSAQAQTKTGEEADRLFAQAGEKHAAALAIKPDMHEALNNLGIALSAQAQTKTGEEADCLFALAKEKYDLVEGISPGRAAYNLECIAALMRDEDGCRNWLERSKGAGTLPERQHLLADDDLESVRESEWFKDFLKDAYPERE